MVRVLLLSLVCVVLNACNSKKDLPAPADGFPFTANALPSVLAGKWIRTSHLQTFDFKPNEWVQESSDPSNQKYLQINSNKTYGSNQINCGNCQVELWQDTLFIRHNEGFYKFPILLINDSMLHLKTKIDDPAYSLPNTGLFDFVLEEKYKKVE